MNDSDTGPSGRVKAFALCALAYVLALGVAVAVGYALGGRHPILIVLVADVAGTLVIYAFARLLHNASFYDPYWSVAPLAIALYWMLGVAGAGAEYARQVAVVVLVAAWGFRLTYNWARGWRGLKHEDWRYADLRRKSGRRFWLVELMGIEMMPTMVVFLGCLSLYPALTATGPIYGVTGDLQEHFLHPDTTSHALGWLEWVAVAVTAAAIVIEATADEQLKRFARSSRQAGQIMERGLWRYSRHPNYCGEVLFWWGLFLFALAADPGYWWAVAGPLAMTALFIFVSIPMMDRRNLERRPGYAERMQRVSALVPWFPKRQSH